MQNLSNSGGIISGGSRISQMGVTNPKEENQLFGQIFPENCMEMKEIRPRGGHPVGSTNGFPFSVYDSKYVYMLVKRLRL